MMTDIETRARDALNEVWGGNFWLADVTRKNTYTIKAMCRQIEAHDATKAELEAFRRDVSEAAKKARDLIEGYVGNTDADGKRASDFLSRFILPEPVDPLVELIEKAKGRYQADMVKLADYILRNVDRLAIKEQDKCE